MNESKRNVICETERFIIRVPTLEDAPDSFEIYSDPEVMKFIDNEPPFESVDVAKQAIEAGLKHLEKYGVCHFAVEDKKRGKMVGHCGFNNYSDNNDIELVIHINRLYWNKGIASECCPKVIEFAREKFKERKIVALVDPDNKASKKIIDKIGLIFVAKKNEDGYILDYYELK